ncbi:hypothetical protein [Sulfitobacter geojensis]|nr:hypothetical protein [Sulfitobacter geojensis]
MGVDHATFVDLFGVDPFVMGEGGCAGLFCAVPTDGQSSELRAV